MGWIFPALGDNAAALQKWANDAAGNVGPQPNYVFKTGIIAYSAWPTFIVPRNVSQRGADGQCDLKCTSNKDAVTLTGGSGSGLTWRTSLDGFTIVPYGKAVAALSPTICKILDVNVGVPGALKPGTVFTSISQYSVGSGSHHRQSL